MPDVMICDEPTAPPGGPAACELNQEQLAKLIQIRESLETELLIKDDSESIKRNLETFGKHWVKAFDPIIKEESRQLINRGDRREAYWHAQAACWEAFKAVPGDCKNIAAYTRITIRNELNDWRFLQQIVGPSKSTENRKRKKGEAFVWKVKSFGKSDRLVIDDPESQGIKTLKDRHSPKRERIELCDLRGLFSGSDIDIRIIDLCVLFYHRGERPVEINQLVADDLQRDGFRTTAEQVRRCRKRIGETIERAFADRLGRRDRYKRTEEENSDELEKNFVEIGVG